jgi:hypothetical protein
MLADLTACQIGASLVGVSIKKVFQRIALPVVMSLLFTETKRLRYIAGLIAKGFIWYTAFQKKIVILFLTSKVGFVQYASQKNLSV